MRLSFRGAVLVLAPKNPDAASLHQNVRRNSLEDPSFPGFFGALSLFRLAGPLVLDRMTVVDVLMNEAVWQCAAGCAKLRMLVRACSSTVRAADS